MLGEFVFYTFLRIWEIVIHSLAFSFQRPCALRIAIGADRLPFLPSPDDPVTPSQTLMRSRLSPISAPARVSPCHSAMAVRCEI